VAIRFSTQEILETIRMVQMENLDVRTITMGVSLRACAHPDLEVAAAKAYDKICRSAERLVAVGDEIQREYGIPIINKRVSVTPVALVAESSASRDYVLFAAQLERAAANIGINFIGGFSALVHKGTTPGDDAFHGIGEPDCVINVGVSGPGVVLRAIEAEPQADFGELANTIKRTAFKVTRMGELVGRAASAKLGVPFGIVDLSLAPTPAQGDSVARILEAMGLERVGTHGSTAALALLNDAVKKGGAMASSHVGGLSGAFIPVSEDAAMIDAAAGGSITFDKLEAMTCVCSVGLDMIAVPGDTSAATIAAIIADEAAIGMVNRKTTAVRIIPAPGKQVGDTVEFGGLLGRAPVMALHRESSEGFVSRGGRIPAPLQAFNN
jgi:uncharacterized protein (UPF0210 family)